MRQTLDGGEPDVHVRRHDVLDAQGHVLEAWLPAPRARGPVVDLRVPVRPQANGGAGRRSRGLIVHGRVELVHGALYIQDHNNSKVHITADDHKQHYNAIHDT